MKINISKVAVFVFLFYFLGLGSIFAANRVVAVVNNEVITARDLNNYYKVASMQRANQFFDIEDIEKEKEKAKKEILDRLIDDRLILQQAKKEGIEVSASWVQARVNQLAAGYPSLTSFSESLEREGFSLAYLKRRFRQQYLTRTIIDQRIRAQISISPRQISQYYQDNREAFQGISEAVFFMASDKDRSNLERIAGRIDRSGISRAKDRHKNELSRFDVRLDQLKESLAEVLLEIGDGSHKIIETQDGYRLLYRKKVKPSRFLALAEVQDKIYRILWEKEFSLKFNQWVDSLREEAVIRVYFP